MHTCVLFVQKHGMVNNVQTTVCHVLNRMDDDIMEGKQFDPLPIPGSSLRKRRALIQFCGQLEPLEITRYY